MEQEVHHHEELAQIRGRLSVNDMDEFEGDSTFVVPRDALDLSKTLLTGESQARLSAYVKGRRWFLADKRVPLRYFEVSRTSYEMRDTSEPVVFARWVVSDGLGELWNLPVVISSVPLESEVSAICEVAEGAVYEACSTGIGRLLLLAQTGVGFTDAASHAPRFEQSNTSFVIGNMYVKLYRRLLPHPNREVMVLQALAGRDDGATPEFIAAGQVAGFSSELVIEACLDCGDFYQEFKRIGTGRSVAELEARLSSLGEVLANLHSQMYDSMPREPTTVGVVAEGMAKRIRALSGELLGAMELWRDDPETSEVSIESRKIRALSYFNDFSSTGFSQEDQTGDYQLQFIHGDLHLGQILLRDDTEMIIDFEGEVLGETISNLRAREYDVAGVLRSIDYALHESEFPSRERRAVAMKLEEALVESYSRRSELLGKPTVNRLLLELSRIEKALYEIKYELKAERGLLKVPFSCVLNEMEVFDR